MAYEFKAQRRVEFSETDLAGIVHYSNFFRYMETAEHGFFRALGFSIAPRQFAEGETKIGWPRVHASCDYRKPLRFEDIVEIHLLVVERKTKAITYQIRFNRVSGDTREEVARGRLTVVCVAWDEATSAMKATTIPAAIASQIEAAPAELLAD